MMHIHTGSKAPGGPRLIALELESQDTCAKLVAAMRIYGARKSIMDDVYAYLYKLNLRFSNYSSLSWYSSWFWHLDYSSSAGWSKSDA